MNTDFMEFLFIGNITMICWIIAIVLFKNRKKFGIKKEIRERIINVISSNIPKYHTLKSEEQGK